MNRQIDRPKVVLWRPMYHPVGHSLLADKGAELLVVDSGDLSVIKEALCDAKALWVRTPERVTAEILDAGRNLVVVSTSGLGTDNIDIAAATERGILVVNHRGFGRVPVSEHAILMILALGKQLVSGDQAVRNGTAWNRRSGLHLTELAGKTVGIVGIGFIGSELARKLGCAFGCRVLGFDPYADQRLCRLAGVEMLPVLSELLRQSDILVLVPELTAETRGMIGATELAALPKGALVVNVGRGQVLDLEALLRALDSDHLAGAALDVFYPEPLPQGHPLLANPKVILSPHVAGTTIEASFGMAHSAVQQIDDCLHGRMPSSPVNPTAWDCVHSRRPDVKRLDAKMRTPALVV